MAPIRSRCLSIRIDYPQASDVFKTLTKVSEQEGYSSSVT